MKKKTDILWVVLVVVVVAVGGWFLLTSDASHIEDTNGPDDISLATITDQNIIHEDIPALGVEKSTGILNDGITFKSDKFSGVYRVFLTNFILDSDFLMDVAGFTVDSGNFRMVLVNDGKIVAEVEPGMFPTVELEGLKGDFSLVIAGESADFQFTLDRLFCEQYDITVGD